MCRTPLLIILSILVEMLHFWFGANSYVPQSRGDLFCPVCQSGRLVFLTLCFR